MQTLNEFRSRNFSIEGTREMLGGCDRSHIYDLVLAGRLVAIKDGSRTIITGESLADYIASLPRAAIMTSSAQCKAKAPPPAPIKERRRRKP